MDTCEELKALQRIRPIPAASKKYYAHLRERHAAQAACCTPELVKHSNSNYYTQGAVDSSARIHNLKYETAHKLTSEDKRIQQDKTINLQDNQCTPYYTKASRLLK